MRLKNLFPLRLHIKVVGTKRKRENITNITILEKDGKKSDFHLTNT